MEPSSTASAKPQSAPPAGAHNSMTHSMRHDSESLRAHCAVGCKVLEAWLGKQAAHQQSLMPAQHAAMCEQRTHRSRVQS